MRKGLVVLMLLAWPMASFGAVDMNLLGGSVDFNPDEDTSIDVVIQVVADSPFDGLEWMLTTNSAMDTMWSVSNLDASANVTALSNAYPLYTMLATPGTTSLADAGSMGREVWFRDFGLTAAGTYSFLTVTLVPLVDMEPFINQSMTLTTADDGLYTATNQEPGEGPLGGSALTINIVPEPASALLLLLAVPFIRRRTA
ncbi:MAG: hypothetical protein GXY44_12960 [Phycisphaerales bacterium]|nr:hypothetical protein [Phycisphaerales bacterium]